VSFITKLMASRAGASDNYDPVNMKQTSDSYWIDRCRYDVLSRLHFYS